MKKVILIIISIVLVMMTGCEGIKYVKKRKDDLQKQRR